MIDKGSNKIAWIEAGFQMLSEGGIDSVRVDRISKKIGLTRGSFYWHFKNRAELLDAMLELWYQKSTNDIIELIEQEKTNPNNQLSALLNLTAKDVDAKYGGKFTEMAIRIWSKSSPKAADIIKQIDLERVKFVNKLLNEMNVEPALASFLAEIIYNAYIGMASRDLSEEEVTRISKIAGTYIEDQIAQAKL
ncbi:MAG: hypothetical protein COB24_04475 [Hyphomicrobiales bacterium]|nr:MAG: hypothetical protein COB24_04475 [Hyphomicrobiales bacterium]